MILTVILIYMKKQYLIDEKELMEKQEIIINQGKAKMKYDFSNIKVLLIGDFMIDQYIFGSSNRMSPEAPVPVLIPEKDFSCARRRRKCSNKFIISWC